ncbi:flagellar basal body-associated protein FliL [soil metagenome]
MSAPETDSEIVEDDALPPTKPPRFSKRLVVIAGAALLLVLAGIGVTGYLLLSGGPAKPGIESQDEGDATYVDAPAMVVNLRGADGAARFLKIRFTLVPTSAAKGEEIKAKLPRIVDAFQPFLRELRPEDLAGSAAVFRIKEEMLVRATAAMGPGVVKDILIQDLIQQ